MKNIYRRLRNLTLRGKIEVNKAIASFSKKEWRVFLVLLGVLIITTVLILENINKSFMVKVPIRGGSVSEGIVGTPRFINPVLAFSDVDRDLITLVYSGLMRKSEDGTLIPDLAESYEASEDGLVYTFIIKEDAYFHDETKVTAEDVVFTISSIKDPLITSPRKSNWDGVTVEAVDERTVRFNLKQPYTSFLESTTLGILPKALWSNSPIELNNANTAPVGSGPFKIEVASKQSSGIIDHFKLAAFEDFALGKPYLKTFDLYFYANENDLIDALKSGKISQISSITPSNAQALKSSNFRIESSVLPRVFGLFFNQSQNQLFTNKAVVKAIDQIIDKDRIVREVLGGYGVVIDDPIPPNMTAYQKFSIENKAPREKALEEATALLAKDGWVKNTEGFLEKTTTQNKKKTTIPLEFSISTVNAPELAKSATLIAEDLAQFGIKVDVKTFELGNLNQSVIRPRKYDALLFGQIINNESDLFAFWHSSQRKDPGLNIALYTNAKVDKILEDAFITLDEKVRIEKYGQFENEIKKDMPAIFLYSPNFIYVVSDSLQGLDMEHLATPQDRFLNSYLWYTKTDNVWKIFSK